MHVESFVQLLTNNQVERSDGIVHPLGNNGEVIVSPKTEEEICSVLSYAYNNMLTVVIEGGGTKKGFGGLLQTSNILLSLRQYKGIVEYSPADFTMTVKAGTTIKEINDYLKRFQQTLPFDCPWPTYSTIGGVVAANSSGPKRLKYGAVRDNVLGLRVIYPDGSIVRTGGRVVKNVAGYDMTKLMIGAMGTLGVISEVTIRLRPIQNEETVVIVTVPYEQLEQLQLFMEELQNSFLEPAAFEMLNGTLSFELTGEYGCSVAIAFSDGYKAVDYQVNWIYEHVPSIAKVKILKNVKSMQFWGKLATLPPNGEFVENEHNMTIALKIGSKQRDVISILNYVEKLGEKYSFIVKSHGGVGYGISHVFVTSCGNLLIPFIEKVRKYSEQLGGYTIVTHLPLSVRTELQIWGDKPPHFPYLLGIKKQIDPQMLLNSQRFVGGI